MIIGDKEWKRRGSLESGIDAEEGSVSMEQNAWFEHSFVLAPTGMALLSPDGRFVRVNEAFTRLLGYTDEELLKIREADITFPGDIPVSEAAVLSLLTESTISGPLEKRYIHKLGNALSVSIQVSFISGKPEGERYIHMFTGHPPDVNEGKAFQPEAAELHKLISEHSQDLIMYSVDNVFHYVSTAALGKLLGYKPEEIIGRDVSELLHPDDAGLLDRSWTMAEENVNCRMRRKDGCYLWFDVMVKCIPKENGSEPNAMFVARDITEREQMLSALRRSERSLAEAQRIAGLGSWEWDIAADRFTLSDEMYRILELSPLHYDGTCEMFLDQLHPEERNTVHKAIREAVDGHAFHLDCCTSLKNSKVRSIRMQGVAAMNQQGQAYKLQGTIQDITSQQLMFQMLEESLDRYNSLKKYNLDAIISLNMQGEITSANPAAERITGYTALDLIGMRFTELVHKDETAWAELLFRRILHDGLFSSSETRICHKQGETVELLVTPAPIYVGRRQTGCYIIAKDITVQKRQDELLLKSEKLTIAGQLAAGVAHEIRNPLTALKGFVQLMSRSADYHGKYLPIMLEELERIELIISELLMLAKPQAVQMKMMDLSVILHDVVLLLGAQAMLQNIEIHMNKYDSRFLIRCDPGQMKQVFINFLKNAIESMKDGGMIKVELHSPDEKVAVVRISDQGCGIPKEQLRLIGEPFYSTKEAGTGLGLLVSHKIIEHHEGRIVIESEMNVGTTIEVTLPTVEC